MPNTKKAHCACQHNGLSGTADRCHHHSGRGSLPANCQQSPLYHQVYTTCAAGSTRLVQDFVCVRRALQWTTVWYNATHHGTPLDGHRRYKES